MKEVTFDEWYSLLERINELEDISGASLVLSIVSIVILLGCVLIYCISNNNGR